MQPSNIPNILRKRPPTDSSISMESNVQPRIHWVAVFSDGFTVDGGTFRDQSLLQNEKFLKSIESGMAPAELCRGGGKLRIRRTIFKGTYQMFQNRPNYIRFLSRVRRDSTEMENATQIQPIRALGDHSYNTVGSSPGKKPRIDRSIDKPRTQLDIDPLAGMMSFSPRSEEGDESHSERLNSQPTVSAQPSINQSSFRSMIPHNSNLRVMGQRVLRYEDLHGNIDLEQVASNRTLPPLVDAISFQSHSMEGQMEALVNWAVVQSGFSAKVASQLDAVKKSNCTSVNLDHWALDLENFPSDTSKYDVKVLGDDNTIANIAAALQDALSVNQSLPTYLQYRICLFAIYSQAFHSSLYTRINLSNKIIDQTGVMISKGVKHTHLYPLLILLFKELAGIDPLKNRVVNAQFEVAIRKEISDSLYRFRRNEKRWQGDGAAPGSSVHCHPRVPRHSPSSTPNHSRDSSPVHS